MRRHHDVPLPGGLPQPQLRLFVDHAGPPVDLLRRRRARSVQRDHARITAVGIVFRRQLDEVGDFRLARKPGDGQLIRTRRSVFSNLGLDGWFHVRQQLGQIARRTAFQAGQLPQNLIAFGLLRAGHVLPHKFADLVQRRRHGHVLVPRSAAQQPAADRQGDLLFRRHRRIARQPQIIRHAIEGCDAQFGLDLLEDRLDVTTNLGILDFRRVGLQCGQRPFDLLLGFLVLRQQIADLQQQLAGDALGRKSLEHAVGQLMLARFLAEFDLLNHAFRTNLVQRGYLLLQVGQVGKIGDHAQPIRRGHPKNVPPGCTAAPTAAAGRRLWDRLP